MGQADNRVPLVEVAEEMEKISIPENDGVGPGKKITLHFSLSLIKEGSIDSKLEDIIIDSNFDKAPVTFSFGDGNLLPGFENAIVGMQVGDKGTFKLNSENAFGIINEDNIQGYPRYQFPADLVLENGLMISFSDAAGNDQAGVVKDFDSDKVVIDFNHPLAGEMIDFRVEIIEIVDT